MNLTLLPGKRLKNNLRKPPTSVSVPASALARLLIRASVTCGGHTSTSCDPRANKRACYGFGSTDWSLSLIELRSAYRKLHKSVEERSGAALHPKQIIFWFSFWFLSISANILFVRARVSRYPCANIDACACAHLSLETGNPFDAAVAVAVVFHLVFACDLG